MEILWIFVLKEVVGKLLSCARCQGGNSREMKIFCFIKNLLKIQHKRMVKSV